MENILTNLKDVESELHKPFPYDDIDKILDDFRLEFDKLSSEEDGFTGDFNTYSMVIAGSLSYVLAGNSNKIPKEQIHNLQYSFFDYFNQYKFLEDKIAYYKNFYEEYSVFEKARKLLLQVISK
jgi:YxiJ-like protein